MHQQMPTGDHSAMLAEKQDTSDIRGIPATKMQLVRLAEKLSRKYSTSFDARIFKERVVRFMRRSA